MTDYSPQEKLQDLLQELFRFDTADLDFGIYQILNQRRDRLQRFIENDLSSIVEETLAVLASKDKEIIQEELEEKKQILEATLGENALKPSGQVKDQYADTSIAQEYQKLRENLKEAKTSQELRENIFNDVYRFFSRYYEEGDFVAQRRYSSKEAKYSLPYNGEEILFHWANKNQYYVKSSLHFSNYVFEAGDRKVEFVVADAEEPTDNVKGEDRYFVLSENPIEVEDSLVKIHFEHRKITEEEADSIVDDYNEATGEDKSSFTHSTNKKLCTALEHRILSQLNDEEVRDDLEEDKEEKTVLRRHLERFTTENEQDFFIHKDLQGFLERELDVYLKTELLNTEDLLKSDSPETEPPMHRARAVRKISEKIIEFLSKIEDFQKRLFEKKKFIYQTDYMVTIDKVPEALWHKILDNDEQIERWKEVYSIEEWESDLLWRGEFDEEFLENHPHLMIDTALFDQEFKAKLLASFEDIEEETDGLLIHGENFQGLNLLRRRFEEEINFVYIDPPYNTSSTPIIYKNNFKHSSWLSMMADRLSLSETFLPENGLLTVTIDDNEVENLWQLMKREFDGYEIDPVIIEYNYRGRAKRNFAVTHEYSLWATPQGKDLITKSKQKADDIKRNLRRTGTDSMREDSPNLFYGIEVEKDSLDITSVTEPLGPNEDIPEHTNSDTVMVWPIDSEGNQRRWYYGHKRVREEAEEDNVYAKRINGDIEIHYYQEGTRKNRKSVWKGSKLDASTYGTELLNDMFGPRVFDFPKSLHAVRKSIESATFDKDAQVMDYFAGSGTTPHAVIDMNREDEGNRSYIAIEMGGYFDTVLKPRIQKAVFASDWKEGMPQDSNGISHMLKYQRIESYEDSLGNIKMSEITSGQAKIVDPEDDEYLLNYMFEQETKGSPSLLTEDAFESPFEYSIKVQGKGNMSKRQNDEQAKSLKSPELEEVDLVETFHYLIGARVRQYRETEHQGRRYVITKCEVDKEHGTDEVLTVWRPTENLDYNKEEEWFEDEFGDLDVNTVYTNGESHIPNWKPLEPVFRERMESGTDAS